MIDAKQILHDTDTGGDVARWIGLLLPPAAWAVQLQSLWLSTEYGCEDSNFFGNHAVSVIALILSLIGGIIAWSYIPEGEYGRAKEKGTPAVRKRFMGYISIALAVEFSILIVAMWLPTLLGVPCHK